MNLAMLADTTAHVVRTAAPEPPLGVYISLASLALAVAGILWKGGVMVGENRATRREHHKRISDLEEGAKSATEARITRQELDARFAELRSSLAAMSERVGDAVTLMTEALKR